MFKRIVLIATLLVCCVTFLSFLLFYSPGQAVIQAQSGALEDSPHTAEMHQIAYSDVWNWGEVVVGSTSEGISIGARAQGEFFSDNRVPEYYLVGDSPFTVEVTSLRLMVQKSGEYTGALNIDAQVIGPDGSFRRQTSSGSIDVVSQPDGEWIELPISSIEGATIVYPDEFLVARVTREGAPVYGLSFMFTMQAGVSSPPSQVFLPTIRQ
jgi:hypothetical protein